MKAPTKEQLCEALEKASEGIFESARLHFQAYGSGGCDGAPCVQIREQRMDVSINFNNLYQNGLPVVSKNMEELYKEIPFKELITWGMLYKTVAIAFVEKDSVFCPTNYVQCLEPFVGYHYYYNRYDSVDDLAKVLIQHLKKILRITVL